MMGVGAQALLQWRIILLLGLILPIAIVADQFFEPFNVSYDHRSLVIGGQRRMLISAGIHYPRATPEMWPDLIAKSKEGGAEVIETYTFWNGHEPVRGKYYFEGRYDLVKFAKLVGSNGLYLFLRIGPYVCAEWNFGYYTSSHYFLMFLCNLMFDLQNIDSILLYVFPMQCNVLLLWLSCNLWLKFTGQLVFGFPVWLRDIPGIEFRTDNAPFKEEMERFVTKIVNLMREEMLFSWQGGPIIMLQIENEYGDVEHSYGSKGQEYVKWAANMAIGLGAGVPWVMCKQSDAPEFIINTCNSYYCDGFTPNSNKKPIFWTEDWDGWYTTWGGRLPHRPVEDLAFAVARFFQRGGSFQNYYMYFGGTNFGRTAGGPFYITSYDYDAPIDEYGLLSQPKWGHLKDLHAAIKLCEPALVAVDSSQYHKLGPKQEAHIYHNKGDEGKLSSSQSGDDRCSAFLANIDEHNAASVRFQGRVYTLPPWSVSILPDCKNVAYNSAKTDREKQRLRSGESNVRNYGSEALNVGAQKSITELDSDLALISNTSVLQKSLHQDRSSLISEGWMTLDEPVGVWSDHNFTVQGILEHLNVTKDSSDYLWYFTRIYVSGDDILFWKRNGVNPALTIDSMRDVVHIFVNGKLVGILQRH
ncbi:hypothetical protein Cgig2_030468 [Carnegiea gigantea]|uniref:Beta-galactosidase n=1 Tax=Carnegiea gigantea TaxID=171969 RepID=A0A9Q1QM08_9CARY|nr:hypothetical protein Cgig2_030468 [Carnegiea gigantea]